MVAPSAVPTDAALTLAYIGSFVFGGLVGVSELLSRYKSDPVRAIRQVPALFYVFINATASLSALALIRFMHWLPTIGGGGEQTLLTQSLIAAFGAMAFFRTSLFTVRVGSSDLQVGPAAFLQVILNAADRECDRLLARPRARAVAEIMSNVSFAKANQALPTLCFSLMQNVKPEEQQDFANVVKNLVDSKMDEGLKANSLGLALMNVVGESVLREAVSILRQAISDPLRPVVQSIATLGLLSRIKFASAQQIVDQCLLVSGQYQIRRSPSAGRRGLFGARRSPPEPEAVSAATNRSSLARIVKAIGAMDLTDNNKVLYLALAMINLFSEEILQTVLRSLPENQGQPSIPVTPTPSGAS